VSGNELNTSTLENINMSGTNPFSTSNASQHNLVSKVIGNAPYQVAVDLVDIDIVHARQLGTPDIPIDNAFINFLGTDTVGTNSPVLVGNFKQIYANKIGAPDSLVQTEFIDTIYPNHIGSGDTYGGDAYIRQIYADTIGSGQTYVSDIFVDTLHWSRIVGITFGITGGTGIQITTDVSGPNPVDVISANLIPGTGISFVYGSDKSITIESYASGPGGSGSTGATGATGDPGPTGSTASVNIGTVTTLPPGSLATVTDSGTQYAGILNFGIPQGATGPTGPAGSGTGGSIPSGPPGQLLYYGFNGQPTSSSRISYNPSQQKLAVPSTSVGSNGATLTFTQQSAFGGGNNYIQSELSKPLYTSGSNGRPRATLVNPASGTLSIRPNPEDYPFPTIVDLRTSSDDSFQSVIGTTYNIYVYGGGGTGSANASGGAGGFVGVTNVPGGLVYFWNVIGGSVVMYNAIGSTYLVAPAGGAGGSQGNGAAYGEPGGSYLGQGYSAVDGGLTGGIGGSYNDVTGPQAYILPADGLTANIEARVSIQGLTFGLTGFFPANSTVTGYGNIVNYPQLISYFFPAGSTMTISSTDPISPMIFYGCQIPVGSGFTYAHILGSTGLPAGTTGYVGPLVGTVGGTATYNPSTVDQPIVSSGALINSNTQIPFDSNFIDINITNQPTFNVTSISIDNPAGLTLSFTPPPLAPAISDVPLGSTGTLITISAGSTFNFSNNLLTINSFNINNVGLDLSTIDIEATQNNYLPSNTIIAVEVTDSVFQATNGDLLAGGTYGGGVGYYGGGGGAGGGGGGAGAAFVPVGGFTGAGSGIIPFTTQYYNYTGEYGYGGTTGSGGPPLVVFEVAGSTGGVNPYALIVNGPALIRNRINAIPGFAVSSGTVQTWNEFNAGQGSSEFCNYMGDGNGGFGFWQAPKTYPADNFGSIGGLRLLNIDNSGAFWPSVGTLTVGNIVAGNPPNASSITSGNIRAEGIVYGNDLVATSDSRIKENVVTIDSALDKVMRMRGVYFTKKNEDKRRTGVIAQEVEEVFPEVVYTDGTEDNMKSVSYGSMIGLLIEAIKEQQKIIKNLQV